MSTIGELPEAAMAVEVIAAQATAALPPQASPAAPLLDVEVQPSIAAGRRARYAAVVSNRSAYEVDATLSVTPADARVQVLVLPSAIVLGPGQSAHAEVHLRPRRRLQLRREIQHRAEIVVRVRDGAVAATRPVIFVQQRPRPSWPFALLILAAAVAAASGVLSMPERVSVPAVEGAQDVAAAEAALVAAGLELDPRLRSRTTTGARPGTILDQIPDPGTRIRRGERVTLLVAIGSKRAVTPALGGQTRMRAAAVLRAAGLLAGPILPAGAPASAIVASQLPAAGARVPAGTAVTLFVRARRAVDASSRAAEEPARSGATAAVPAIDGRSVNEYARAVGAAGLVPKVIRKIDPAPLGTLVGVRPRPGLPAGAGTRVRLLVAAGVPRLAFDTGSVLRLFDPRLGRTVREASPPQGQAVEPSWSPDGRRLLYRVGRRLLLVSARLSDRGRIVYEGTTKYAAATFAPAPAAGELALVRRTGDDGDLCFARIGATQLRPRCSADTRWDLGRQISWRRGGRELLVFGVRRGRPDTFGILRYHSTRAFSTDPADWRGELATDTPVAGRGVIAAAYSPSGSDVAFATNIALPRFQLGVAPAGDLRDPAAQVLPVRACEVAWRPDGQELAVVQSDDACGRPVGDVVRVIPTRPRQTVTVSSGGRHPAYQPLTYAGPKGVS